MIERFYLRDHFGFKEVELDLKRGIVVFSGPSGSGKTVLMNSILSSLGIESCEAALCESSTNWRFDSTAFEMQDDDGAILRHIKKEKSRYFINNQAISKKDMSTLSMQRVKHLSLRDFSDFDNAKLISLLDNKIAKTNKSIVVAKDEFKKIFHELRERQKELKAVQDEQQRVVELKEFASYEISKISSINPKISEDDELLQIKKELSKKEKATKAVDAAMTIFNHENAVIGALDILDIDSSYFNDAMNELRSTLEGANERFASLEDIDIESVLNRIEELSEIKKRYGGIQEALEYKKNKELELQRYENIEFAKSDLEKRVVQLTKEHDALLCELTKLRKAAIDDFSKSLASYAKELYLNDATISLAQKETDENGADEINISLAKTQLQKVSTGEFNRLRLAILALGLEFVSQDGGVLILDEIDANLSGEESMSVAKILKQLSKKFQIFVISHQPQLTSMGDQHFLVSKKDGESFVKELDFESRVKEIARIISGESISQEALKFARELLK